MQRRQLLVVEAPWVRLHQLLHLLRRVRLLAQQREGAEQDALVQALQQVQIQSSGTPYCVKTGRSCLSYNREQTPLQQRMQ